MSKSKEQVVKEIESAKTSLEMMFEKPLNYEELEYIFETRLTKLRMQALDHRFESYNESDTKLALEYVQSKKQKGIGEVAAHIFPKNRTKKKTQRKKK